MTPYNLQSWKKVLNSCKWIRQELYCYWSTQIQEHTRSYRIFPKDFYQWKAPGVICHNWHMLDNKALEELKQAFHQKRCKVELMHADIHQCNAAEHATQTFKGHFISVLPWVVDNFPIHQWDNLILQKWSIIAPTITAYTYHHGHFNYNCTSIAPIGCAVQFHIKPAQQCTWGEHSGAGWYLHTSPKHTAVTSFLSPTCCMCIMDLVFFKHKYLTQPPVTAADCIIKVYKDLMKSIQGINNFQGSMHTEALKHM